MNTYQRTQTSLKNVHPSLPSLDQDGVRNSVNRLYMACEMKEPHDAQKARASKDGEAEQDEDLTPFYIQVPPLPKSPVSFRKRSARTRENPSFIQLLYEHGDKDDVSNLIDIIRNVLHMRGSTFRPFICMHKTAIWKMH